ncbi:MAG: ABC transporter ATP-binding protein, partial [Bacteroides sp.]
MNNINLQQTLPLVFADRDSVCSDIWHQNVEFLRGKTYLVEAA